jgi:bacteriocin-like protein
MENLEKLNLNELSTDELTSIQGGDKFMYDLGRFCGYWMKSMANIQQGGF